MRHRDSSFVIALCLSLAAHGAVSAILLDRYAGELNARLPLAALDQKQYHDPVDSDVITDRMGQAHGKGEAVNLSLGESPPRAPRGIQDQAFLSRDPVGNGRIVEESVEWADLAGDQNGRAIENPAPAQQSAAPEDTAIAFGVKSPGNSQPAPEIESPSSQEWPAVGATPASPSLPSRTQGDAGVAPTIVPSAADPAPMSDSESDPFSKTGSVDFRDGKADVRFGRKVKTVRPKILLGGQIDLVMLRFPGVTLAVTIDETGKVTAAEILQSSGSSAVDLPCQVAMYDWWIEPPKDKGGKPMRDVMIWQLTFR